MKSILKSFILPIITSCLFASQLLASNPILNPGVTYEASKMDQKGGYLGLPGPERLTIQITTYNDGSVSGKLILTAINEYRNNEETSNTFKLSGTWRESTRKDKRVMVIRIDRIANANFIFPPELLVDEQKRLYMGDLGSDALYLSEWVDYEAEYDRRIDEQYQLLREHRAYFEEVDLGLSVKWSSLNYTRLEYIKKSGDYRPYILNNNHGLIDDFGNTNIWSAPRYESKNPYDLVAYLRQNRMSDEDIRKSVDVRRDCKELIWFWDNSREYVAGGKYYGYPLPYSGEEILELLKRSYEVKNNDKASVDEVEAYLSRWKDYEWHVPTKYEWKELIDNCTTSVEVNPIKDSILFPSYRKVNRKLLRFTSKINGNSIVLPFDGTSGTDYWTSQSLSSDPNYATYVSIDTSGNIEFKEGSRMDGKLLRYVYGRQNSDAIAADIKIAENHYNAIKDTLSSLELNQLKPRVNIISLERSRSSSPDRYDVTINVNCSKIDYDSHLYPPTEFGVYYGEDENALYEKSLSKEYLRAALGGMPSTHRIRLEPGHTYYLKGSATNRIGTTETDVFAFKLKETNEIEWVATKNDYEKIPKNWHVAPIVDTLRDQLAVQLPDITKVNSINLVERGIYYGESEDSCDKKVIDLFGLCIIDGSIPGKDYYIKSYVKFDIPLDKDHTFYTISKNDGRKHGEITSDVIVARKEFPKDWSLIPTVVPSKKTAKVVLPIATMLDNLTIVERGVYYGETEDSCDKKVISQGGECKIEDLLPGTAYYLKSYIKYALTLDKSKEGEITTGTILFTTSGKAPKQK